jgi:prevent-host-death family protein
MDRSRPRRTTRKARTVSRPRAAPVAAAAAPATAFTATDAKKEFGRVLEIVLRGGRVLITRHDQPKAVVLSMDEFTALTQATERTLEALGGQFDALLAGLQTPKARAGLRAAFEATPRELGRAAVAAARRRG